MVGLAPQRPGNEAVGADARQLRLALAQLPGRMRRATLLFRGLTGFSVVTGLKTAVEDEPGACAITPPIHPQCTAQLRGSKDAAPCKEQWQWHLKVGLRNNAGHSHVCPVGLRCSCVPIFYGRTLVGTAKLVVGRDTPARRFSIATQALELVVSRVCSDFHVSALTEELEGARRRVAELLDAPRSAYPGTSRNEMAAEAQPEPAPVGSLVDRTLGLLATRFLDRSLSLVEISRALAVNDKYLTRLFTRVVGQHMHEYIVSLRVHHACRLLLSSDRPIKEIAYESGFRSPDRFRRAFRDNVGVAPTTYRRIFTAN